MNDNFAESIKEVIINYMSSEGIVFGLFVSFFLCTYFLIFGLDFINSVLESIEKKFNIKFNIEYDDSQFYNETVTTLFGIFMLCLITCIKGSAVYDLLAWCLDNSYRGESLDNCCTTILVSFVSMCYIFICTFLVPSLLENIRFLFYKCIRKEPKRKHFFLKNSITCAVLLTPIILIGFDIIVIYFSFLAPIKPYVLEATKTIKSTIFVIPGTSHVNLLGFAFYSVQRTVVKILLLAMIFLTIISPLIILYKLCKLVTKNEDDANELFGSILSILFILPIVAIFIAMLSSKASLFIIGIFGIIAIISFIAATIFKGVGETVAYGVSSGLQAAGVSKSTSNAVGAVAGGVVAGALLKTTVNTVKDTISSQPSGSNQVDTSDLGINPDQIHVNGYYRRDGTYVHGHQRTKPNGIIGDNISSK